MDAFSKAQAFMVESGIDAWLVYDFRGSNPVFDQLVPGRPATTRRCFLIIPAAGEPSLLVHAIELGSFQVTGIACTSFEGRETMTARLTAALSGCRRVAMEYSPAGELPTMSWVDAGSMEVFRALGPDIVSSADLFQAALATWSEAGLNSHLSASELVASIKDEAFDYVRRSLKDGRRPTECDVQEFISDRFSQSDLEADHAPIVAVNAHSGDPHYVPEPATCSTIGPGDWLLIDMWARHPSDENLFADITWVGYAGAAIPDHFVAVFDIVRSARDLVVIELQSRLADGLEVEGWQLDDVARDHISEAGYGAQFVHRTGHSLGPGPRVHGLGVNLDNLETRDTRRILPGSGFTIEPGIYLPEFGVRLEINVYIDPEKGPQITTPVQSQIILL